MARDESYLKGAIAFLFFIFFFSSVLYAQAEAYTLWESFFYMVLTITTVGSGKYIPQTFAGEVITVGSVILGMGVVLFIVTVFARDLITGKVRQSILSKLHRHPTKKNQLVSKSTRRGLFG
jgi:hypothetical protein